MNARTYSLGEIDRMREALWFLLRPHYGITGTQANELAATVERRLRTYLMAGIEPSELFVCDLCGRRQTHALENEPGGITCEQAQLIGWVLDEPLWLCPFCAEGMGRHDASTG